MWDRRGTKYKFVRLTLIYKVNIILYDRVYVGVFCACGENMIDIHTHLLYEVDDGANSIEESLAMLEDAKAQGVEAMILTPHYRRGMFRYPTEQINENFSNLKAQAQDIGVELYLGTEYHVNDSMVEHFRNGRCHTLAGTSYVLAEYKPETEFSYIKASVQDLLFHGYVPIVAHIERYACMDDLKRVAFLREIGVMIQVNADAVIGKQGFRAKGYTKKLLKKGYVDFVASDCHGYKERKSNMGKCKEYLLKKYDDRYVHQILYGNANKILQEIEAN